MVWHTPQFLPPKRTSNANEAKQADLGKTKSKNYKIPAVCKLDGVDVKAIYYIFYI
jgi:hypothetical protein